MGSTIPVTVLTGFLGSGKTTLLNRILSEHHGQRIAVIENEFGEIGVDQDLVINADEEVFEMNNGCICCTVRGDLIRILGRLAKRRERFDRVIVETTGMADPGPVAQTFFVDEDVRNDFALDGIITLVDAKHLPMHIDTSSEAVAQIAFADVILLNKTDLVSPTELAALHERVRKLNGMARIENVRMADAPLDAVLDVGGFDLDRALETKPTFLEPEYPFEWAAIYDLPAGTYAYVLENGPDPTMAIALEPVDDPTTAALEAAAEKALRHFSAPAQEVESGATVTPGAIHWRLVTQGDDQYCFRVRIDNPGRYALFTEHLPSEFQSVLLDDTDRVVEPLVERNFNPAHSHDDEVSSEAFEFSRPLEIAKFNDWLGALLRERGTDIYRTKGILNIAGSDRRMVFQGVHMLIDGQSGASWGDAPRTSRLVFIGRNLDRDDLERGLNSCMA